MVSIPADLTAFLAEKRDSREYRRALAVKLALLGYRYEAICEMLDVTIGFVSHSKKAYEAHGIAGLTLKYQGTQPYLSASERQAVIDWLKNEQEWSVEHLQEHIQTTYDVVFQSRRNRFVAHESWSLEPQPAAYLVPSYSHARRPKAGGIHQDRAPQPSLPVSRWHARSIAR